MRSLKYAMGLGAVLLLSSVSHAALNGYYFGNMLGPDGIGMDTDSTGAGVNGQTAMFDSLDYLSKQPYGTVTTSTSQATIEGYLLNPMNVVSTFTSTNILYGDATSPIGDTGGNQLQTFLNNVNGVNNAGTDYNSLNPAGSTLTTSELTNLTGQMMEFAGYIDLAPGDTTFYLQADNGAFMYLNGSFFLDTPGLNVFGAGAQTSATFDNTTSTDQLYAIQLVYYEGTGSTFVDLDENGTTTPIPNGNLFPTIGTGVPLPATGPMALVGFGALAAMMAAKKALA